MSTIKEELELDYQEEAIEEGFLYKKALLMPDKFSLKPYMRNKSRSRNIPFDSVSNGFKIYVKMHLYSLLTEEGLGENSVISEFYTVRSFLEYIENNALKFEIKDIAKADLMEYISHLKSRVVGKFKAEGGIDFIYAHKQVSSVKKFLTSACMEGINELNFIESVDVAKLLPLNKPQFYYKGKDLQKYYVEKEKSHKDKTLEYSLLIEIIDSMEYWEDRRLVNLAIILLHTGLRVSEALNLDVNCYSEVTDDEIKGTDFEYVDGVGFNADWKELYWLDNYSVSKTKKGDWEKGNPILINGNVKAAIDELVELSEESRRLLLGTDGQTKIFASTYNGNATVLSVSLFNKRKKAIIEKLNIPYFSFHQFRYTFAKLLYDSGIPLPFIKKYLNHIYTDMTAHYTATSKEDKMNTYEEFTNSKYVVSASKDKVEELRGEFKEVMDSEHFQAMTFDTRLELLNMVADNRDMGINVMDHGICLLPEGTKCPNNYTEVNSCLDEQCNKFATTETSIPHIEGLVSYREKAIGELKKLNYLSAAEYNEKKLFKLKDTLKRLEGGDCE